MHDYLVMSSTESCVLLHDYSMYQHTRFKEDSRSQFGKCSSGRYCPAKTEGALCFATTRTIDMETCGNEDHTVISLADSTKKYAVLQNICMMVEIIIITTISFILGLEIS